MINKCLKTHKSKMYYGDAMKLWRYRDMKNRDKCIAVIFLLLIFVLPALTLISSRQPNELSKEAMAVLINNGTLQGQSGNDMEMENEAAQSENNMEMENEAAQSQNSMDQAIIDEQNGEAYVRQWENVFAAFQNSFADLQAKLNEFTDKLFLRDRFIAANAAVTTFLTGGTYMESTQVLLGKEDWLFYKTQNDGYPIWDYMGINHLTVEQLQAAADNLMNTKRYLEEEKGVCFIAAAIPNKEIVYEEYMPDTIARVNEVSRGQQLAEYIQQNTDVTYVYPLQAFLEYKAQYPLFYQTDTHWNHIGAFVGVQEIFNKAYGYSAAPDSISFKETKKDFAGDLAVIAQVSEEYGIDTIYEFDAESVNPEHKRSENVIVVGDSFGGFLSVIADGYYENVHWIDTDDFTVSMVDEFNADVVIWETVERLQETFFTDSLLD